MVTREKANLTLAGELVVSFLGPLPTLLPTLSWEVGLQGPCQ